MGAELRVGAFTDPATHERGDDDTLIPTDQLMTHGVIVGMTGSGKTGLGVVTIEEALRAGIPCLAIDPKGDLTNLLLTFPTLSADDFAPWVPPGTDAAATATAWTDGLAGWGLGGSDIGQLRERVGLTVFTPGSDAGVPIDLVGAMTPPTVDAAMSTGQRDEIWADEIDTISRGLLSLVGIDSDVLSGREHILIANLIRSAWESGASLDLPGLITQIHNPPLRKLGVIELDDFFPPDDRAALAITLNGLLASPTFAAWGRGEALDIPRLFHGDDGRPRAAVLYLAHLSDAERQWVVSRVLAKLVAWMRTQGGASDLRALVYMDEVMGYVPPTANPPAKAPILTILKQARAFGVGMVLSTQNPVDLDYKALSNAGTWMIGRLQTERDKSRLADGLNAASGGVDVDALGTVISGLEKREFVLHSTGGEEPRTFTVRWAMSYLAGPIPRDRIADLPGQPKPSTPTASTPAPAAPTPPPIAASPVAAPPSAADPVTPPAAPAPLAATPQAAGPQAAGPQAAGPAPTPAEFGTDETAIMPTVADGVAVGFLDAAAPWGPNAGAVVGGLRMSAAATVRLTVLFDEGDVRIEDEWEGVLHPLAAQPDPATALVVDVDDRDVRPDGPPGARYVIPDAPIDTKTFWSSIERSAKDAVYRTHTADLEVNTALDLSARAGEDHAAFAARCDAEGERRADAEADALRKKMTTKIDRLRTSIDRESTKADEARERAESSRGRELLSGAGSVLGALIGGRRSVRSITGGLSKAATARERTRTAAARVDAAIERADQHRVSLEELETDLADALVEIDERWASAAREISTVAIRPEKGDISVRSVQLVWIPVGP